MCGSPHSISNDSGERSATVHVMSPAVDMVPSDDVTTDQSQSSSDSFLTRSRSDPLGSSGVLVMAPAASPNATSFSVINYVGKVQKQSSHRSTVRCRTPYERQPASSTSSRTSQPRIDSIEEATNSSTTSSVDYCSVTTADSASIVSDAPDMVDLDENEADQRPAHHQGHQLNQQLQPHLHHGPRSRRSMSVSSSGCSSSMDDRCDFSPLGSNNSCRCTSLSMSDFDDDGFREDGSVSSMYSVFSSSRSYQPHHPLHHNHQHIPHHPNNTKGLFDIALKTVKLIRRNQELQMRLAQLQEETNAFIESVMSNPENETLRNRFQTATPASSSSSSPSPGQTAMALQ